MNYYLVPQSIAESLQLTRIRKSSAGGLFLLSEYDLQPYGIDRAISEGAMELSGNRSPLPTAEPEQVQQPSDDGGDSPEESGGESQQEQDAPADEPEDGETPSDDPEEEPEEDPEDSPENVEENDNLTETGGEEQ